MIAYFQQRWLVDKVLLVAAAASALLLAGAHAFEHFGRLAPCALCLDQREAHWTALAVAAAGLALGTALRAKRVAAAALGACALVYLVSSGLAFYHVGVEYGYWPGPATCSGGGAVDLGGGDLAGALAKKPSGPSCEDTAWSLFGISMAGYNMLISVGLFALCALAAIGAVRPLRQQGRRAP
ncbi:MAG: disulfide bond formation protein B [Parvularculaceae bacterium]